MDKEYENALLNSEPDINTKRSIVKPHQENDDSIISSIELREEVKNTPVPQFIETGHKLFDKYIPMKGGDFILLGGRAGEGKQVSFSTPILTDSGWKKAGDINKNDLLVSVDGTYTKITGIYPQGINALYRITFDDGAWCDVGLEHLWCVWSTSHGKRDGWKIKNTKQLLKEKVPHAIPLLNKPSPGNSHSLYDPYILGCIIADGTLTGKYPTIYTSDIEIVNYLKERGWGVGSYKNNLYQCWMCKKSEYEKIYSELPKFSKQSKHIPTKLINLVPEERLRLLQGLMDCDGTVDKDGSCSYSTVVRNLADDVVNIVRSLGGKSSIEIKKRISTCGFPECNVRVSHCNRFNPFSLTRKSNRIKQAKLDKRYIKSIKYIGNENAVCFSVEHESKLFVIKDYIVTHNTALAVSLTRRLAKLNRKCLWFSMELSAREFVDRFGEDLPLFYIPRKLKSNTLGWMEQKIDEALKHQNIEVVFIDHLGMIADEATYQNANALDIIKERVNTIKRWAVNKEICIIGISVVKQETNAKKGKAEFDLSDYKGSSDLAHTADTALIMQRIAGIKNEIALNDVLEDNLGMSTEADLHILKCRRTGIMKAKIRMIMDDNGNFEEM